MTRLWNLRLIYILRNIPSPNLQTFCCPKSQSVSFWLKLLALSISSVTLLSVAANSPIFISFLEATRLFIPVSRHFTTPYLPSFDHKSKTFYHCLFPSFCVSFCFADVHDTTNRSFLSSQFHLALNHVFTESHPWFISKFRRQRNRSSRNKLFFCLLFTCKIINFKWYKMCGLKILISNFKFIKW